jgi:hypothetical protein
MRHDEAPETEILHRHDPDHLDRFDPWWGHLLYFLLTGLLWVIPAMLVIKWMAGPLKKKPLD